MPEFTIKGKKVKIPYTKADKKLAKKLSIKLRKKKKVSGGKSYDPLPIGSLGGGGENPVGGN